MKTNIKGYYLKVQPLTPIFIGSGEEIPPYEYVVDQQKYYRINLHSLLESLESDKRLKLVKKMSESIIELRAFIKDLNWKEHVFYQGEASNKFDATYKENLNKSRNQLLVSEYINSNNRIYIPGSSLKGAIRTAYVATYGNNISFDVYKDRKGRVRVKNQRDAAVIEAKTLNYFDRHPYNFFADPFQTIKISDSNFINNCIKVYKANVFTFKKDKVEEGPPIYQESLDSLLASNKEYFFSHDLRIDVGRQKNKFRKNNVKREISTTDILKATKNFSKKIIKAELDFYKYYRSIPEVSTIYNRLNEISSTLKENESLIRFGKGVGYNTVSLNLVNEKKSVTTKSRTFADASFPYGWAIYSIEEVKDNKPIISDANLNSIKIKAKEAKKEANTKVKEEYPDLKTYVEKKYGIKEAKKMALYKLRGNSSLYNKYLKEYNSLFK